MDVRNGQPVSPLWDGVKNLERADREYDRLTRDPGYPNTCASCGAPCRGWTIPGHDGRYCPPCTCRITGSDNYYYDPIGG